MNLTQHLTHLLIQYTTCAQVTHSAFSLIVEKCMEGNLEQQLPGFVGAPQLGFI